METKETYSLLIKSKEFKDWKKKSAGSYLAHVFRMFDEENKGLWQFGYYNSDDTITTFLVEGNSVKQIPSQNIFKKDNVAIAELKMSLVKIDFESAMEKACKIQSEKYGSHPVLKSFAILQKIGNDQVFNITFLTKTFNMLNLRIDSGNGGIVNEKFSSLASMMNVEAGIKQDKDSSYIG
jgi:hypothetical protein